MSEPTTPVTEEDVEPALKPLMFGPTAEYFEDLTEQYYMESGGLGKVADITPHGIILSWVNNGDKARYYPTRTDEFESLIDQDTNMQVVKYFSHTKQLDSPETWKYVDSEQLYIKEWIPFSQAPITTREELDIELNEILLDTVPVSDILDEAANVAAEM